MCERTDNPPIQARHSAPGARLPALRVVLGPMMMLMMALGLFATHAQAGGTDELIFMDAFERPNTVDIANGWTPVANRSRCQPPQGSRDAENSGAVRGQPLPDPRKNAAEARAFAPKIQNGQLYLSYDKSQGIQMVQREFTRELTRVEFNLTPLYAMGGIDDRAWFGLRVYLLDARDNILGEIRHYFYNRAFGAVRNTPTLHSTTVKGAFDGKPRHMMVPIAETLRRHLKGVDRRRIVKTRISFDIFGGWCGTTLEGQVDDVSVFAKPMVLFSYPREAVLEMARLGAKHFWDDRAEFPRNWLQYLHHRHGRKKLTDWLREVDRTTGRDPLKLADLMRKTGLKHEEVPLTAQMLSILLTMGDARP